MSKILSTCFRFPGVLRRLKSSSLHLLFDPYAEYLRDREIILPDPVPADFDLAPLALVLANHTEKTPPALVEELEVLDLFSSVNSLLIFDSDHAEAVAHYREEDDTADDLAIKLLRYASEIVWREFDRKAIQQKRVFVKYGVGPFRTDITPDQYKLDRLTQLLAPQFKALGKSDACRIRPHANADGFTLLVIHGERLARIGILDEHGNSKSTLIRPERLDLIHFHASTGEWSISGIGERLKEAYRKTLGLVFHASENALQRNQKYSLHPLWEGHQCLLADPHSEVGQIRLLEATIETPSGQQLTIRRGDVIASLANYNEPGTQIVAATFAIRLVGRRSQVKVSIRPLANSIDGTVHIPAIERWLVEAGFVTEFSPDVVLESA